MADNMTETESAETSKAPLPRLPMELIHKIFEALLQAAEPVDFNQKRSTFFRALAPYNVNRAMRAEASKKAARHLRFVVDLAVNGPSSLSRPHSSISTTIEELPFPLATLRHIELRISPDPMWFSYLSIAADKSTMVNNMALMFLQGFDLRFIEQIAGTERMPELRTIKYSLDTSATQAVEWKLLNYTFIVAAVKHIQTATPAHVTATVKLDSNGRGDAEDLFFPVVRDKMPGLARKIIMSPDVEFEVERKIFDAVNGGEAS